MTVTIEQSAWRDEAVRRCRPRKEGEGSGRLQRELLIHLAEALRLYPDIEASSVF